MARKFGRFFSDIWRSATDLRFYQEVAQRPFLVAFRHILKIAGIFGTISAVVMLSLLIFLNGIYRWCGGNLPTIVIQNGVAHAEVLQPYRVEGTAGGKERFTVAIDTTGKMERPDPNYRIGVLVKRTGFVFAMGDNIMEWSFTGLQDLTIDKNYFERSIIRYRSMSLYVAGLYAAILLLLIAQSSAAAALGKGVGVLCGCRLSFIAILKMSSYAIALSVCALFFVVLAGVRLQPFYILAIYILTHLAFLFGAILVTGRHSSDENAVD